MKTMPRKPGSPLRVAGLHGDRPGQRGPTFRVAREVGSLIEQLGKRSTDSLNVRVVSGKSICMDLQGISDRTAMQ